MRVLVLTKYPEDGASSRYCVLQYLPWLREAGFECDSFPLYSNALFRDLLMPGKRLIKLVRVVLACLRRIRVVLFSGRYDVVLMHREALPIGPPVLEKLIRRRGMPIVFTYDDALFIFKSNKVDSFSDRFKRPEKYTEIFRTVDCVVAANPWLRDKAAEYCADARYLPAAEDLNRFTPKRYSKSGTGGAVVLGWIGSPSTERYLGLIGRPLVEISKKYPGVVLRVVGGHDFQLAGIPVEHCEWRLDAEVDLLHSFDIGLMPLPDEEWSNGKSGGKARTYMAAALPSVCSRIGFNNRLIADRKTGYLVQTEQEWFDALDALVGDGSLRRRIGLTAREYIEENLSIEIIAPQLRDILREAPKRNGRH